MKISKRLRAIGDLIEDNSFILDVGCDHALLDIYVVSNKKNVKAIASDINEGPLKGARDNIRKYDLEDKIVLSNSDGLESYQEGVDVIILSGLGSTTIIDILIGGKDILDNIDEIIISSNNDYDYLRKNLGILGFTVDKELIVKDRNKYYQVIKFKKGILNYNKYELKYGKISSDSTYIEYLNFNRKKLLEIYKLLGFKYFFSKIKIGKEIRYIDRTLQKLKNINRN